LIVSLPPATLAALLAASFNMSKLPLTDSFRSLARVLIVSWLAKTALPAPTSPIVPPEPLTVATVAALRLTRSPTPSPFTT
jgi:hypothetical protein